MKKEYGILRVGVGKFYYGYGCIEQLIPEVKRLGGKPLIIGGPTTTELIFDTQESELENSGIKSFVLRHTEACSRSWAKKYSELAKEKECTVVVGIGGGKCLDLAKCVATFACMDLICVPTSVATCVASSSVCIMYNNDGTPDGSVQMNKEVDVVIADTDIIATAPKRLLAAGILDSLAKLPEVIHNLDINTYRDCPIEKYICKVNSEAIYDFLINEGKIVYDNYPDSNRLTDVILTNLLHTSVVSGFSCGVNQLALAHGLYDFMRRSFTKQSSDILHGEMVGVGLIMQLVFNEAKHSEVERLRDLMKQMHMPVCLNEIGFINSEENIGSLVDYLIEATGLDAEKDRQKLIKAIKQIQG